ncbi:MAG: hypothetical protein ACXVB0_19415 [Mucilaginibacter sp.]
MTLIRSISRYILILLLLATVLQNKVHAGGFPLRPGRLLLSPSLSYFSASKQWDANSILGPFPNNGKFTSITTTMYMEYGISRRFSFVGSLPYTINDYHQDDYHPGKISGLTDLETGIKYYLASIAHQYFFTVQGTVITPLYTNPNLGYGQTGLEFKAAFAGSGEIFGKNFYFNVENGIRQYFGSIGPVQDRYSGTFGLSLDSKLREQVSVSLGGFYTTSKYKTLTPYQIANFYTSTNFSFKQISLSYGHTFNKQFTMLVSAGKFIAGRNTGDGTSGTLALIYHIDTR